MDRKEKLKWKAGFFMLLAAFIVEFTATLNKAIENKKTIDAQNMELKICAQKIKDINETNEQILKAIQKERGGSQELNEWIAEQIQKVSL
jgi:uncharacterized protein YpmS